MTEKHKIKVLVAEDAPEVLALLTEKLVFEGFAVIPARDGEEAWQKIRQENPDVILLDLMLPKMDGFAVLQNLRQTPSSHKWQPVIIVSARGELEDMKKGYSLEADHYIVKPFKPSEVIRAIHKMLDLVPHRKTHKELHDPSQ